MTWKDLLWLWPLLRRFAPSEIRPLLRALEAGNEVLASRQARHIARAKARGIAAGLAAKASSDATRRHR